ncbi:E3 ubiquitin/ISG15 ligase TRIM25-like [Cheilinus undulatus]|uniref:E3 ubiquitin/ISG15 ligase TRIM25-like n=1 Tax=Cheilinus undulatus TaxID=241271 RepID=UPI001BD2DDDB|nr:E3 ubiquitin/ISG15 ligase TRIM25-like [Cheilinus undulatus]
MATDSRFSSEDQFTCSICLDVFTEPVSIPCGHNFCKGCISLHWEGKELCKCPLCNRKFRKGLKVCVNIAFRDVVESFKKRQSVISNNDTPIKPGQVACNCCLDNKVKASKTCLVCLTSFCETHLEPHRKVAALKRHKLTHPVHNLEDKICKEHNRIVELFCRDDLMNICVQCTEHSDHDIVLLEEAYVDKMARVVMKKLKEQEVKQRQTVMKDKDEATEEQSQQSFFMLVPGNMGISGGRFCYNIELPVGTHWYVGIVRQSFYRKKTWNFNPKFGSWIIRLDHSCICFALYKNPVPFFLIRKPDRVGVCVDYEEGLVSFFDSDTGTPIFSFTSCKFKERVFLFCGQEKAGWVQRLKMKVQNIKPKDILLVFLCMVFFLILMTRN